MKGKDFRNALRRMLILTGLIWILSMNLLMADLFQWNWMDGERYSNYLGNYGTQGVPEINNYPGSRSYSASWTDSAGSMWLFGGNGYSASGYSTGALNDLWKYKPETGNWTWMKGANSRDQSGTYGTENTPDVNNNPGGRKKSVSWIDSAGSLWLFGGEGYDSAGSMGCLNDLWKYNPAKGNWTWVKGADTINQSGTYGALYSIDVNNTPGARLGSISCVDSSGTLWLFGGSGYDKDGNQGYLNDLWKYNPATGYWIWIKGSDTINQFGNYGTLNLELSGNIPGARSNSVSWIDNSGILWMFGGYGYDDEGTIGYLNDLWKYNPSTENWTWVKGNNLFNASGVYGTKGLADAGNVPGARSEAVSWFDGSGALWLFSGYGIDAMGSLGYLNDLWKYNPATGNWTWINGSYIINSTGIYLTPGVPSTMNSPKSRKGGICWVNRAGVKWFFGGIYDTYNYLNDLWRDSSQFTLTYLSGANGSLSGITSQTVLHGDSGTTVTAVPDTHYHFVQWSDGVTTDTRSDIAGPVDFETTATFSINQYTLTYTAGTNGSISGASPQTVDHGADATEVKAVPNPGYSFINWSDLSTDNPRTDKNVIAPISVTANFADNIKPFSMVVSPSGRTTNPILNVAWTTSDAGTGVKSIKIYYRKDRGAWILHGTYTPPANYFPLDTGTGTKGVYDFYSIAEDNAGNIEDPPAGNGFDSTVRVEIPMPNEWILVGK